MKVISINNSITRNNNPLKYQNINTVSNYTSKTIGLFVVFNIIYLSNMIYPTSCSTNNSFINTAFNELMNSDEIKSKTNNNSNNKSFLQSKFKQIESMKNIEPTNSEISDNSKNSNTINNQNNKNPIPSFPPISLNPEYQSIKGISELNYCKEKFSFRYNHCNEFKNCNFCSSNAFCGWCDETKQCIPLEYNETVKEEVPLCGGECVHVLKMGYCHKALFEKPLLIGINKNDVNTKNKLITEINVGNYDDAIKKYTEEKLVGKKYLDFLSVNTNNNFRKVVKEDVDDIIETDYNSNNNRKNNNQIKDISFLQTKQESRNNSNKDDNSKNNSNNETVDLNSYNNSPNSNEKTITSPYLSNLFSKKHFIKDSPSLNYQPEFNSLPKDITIDFSKHHYQFKKDLEKVAKEVFDNKITSKIKENKQQIREINDNDNIDDVISNHYRNIKKSIPGFEMPQFAQSKLESSISDIKKQKLLLLLRGVDLNSRIAKHHLGIYNNKNSDDGYILDRTIKSIGDTNSMKEKYNLDIRKDVEYSAKTISYKKVADNFLDKSNENSKNIKDNYNDNIGNNADKSSYLNNHRFKEVESNVKRSFDCVNSVNSNEDKENNKNLILPHPQINQDIDNIDKEQDSNITGGVKTIKDNIINKNKTISLLENNFNLKEKLMQLILKVKAKKKANNKSKSNKNTNDTDNKAQSLNYGISKRLFSTKLTDSISKEIYKLESLFKTKHSENISK